MNYLVIVYGTPTSGPGAGHALKFCQALHLENHRLQRVFFYHNGAHNADTLAVFPPSEASLLDEWQGLREHFPELQLSVCIGSALKRGILDPGEGKRYQRTSNLHPAFVMASLGDLATATSACDRVITFAQ